MRATGVLALLFVFLPWVANAADTSWPPLPKTGFISGRPATSADVTAGNAAFSAQMGGAVVGKPMAITIPQYAYYIAEKKKTPVIVIQAEEAQGMKMVGARFLSGDKTIAGLVTDFELLGTEAK